MRRKVQIVKLGGSVIAPKGGRSQTPDVAVIRSLLSDISKYLKTGGPARIILVTGSGNYGHHAVKKYGLDTQLAASRVQLIAAKLPKVVAEKLLEMKVPCSIVAPHDVVLSDLGIIGRYLNSNVVPIMYGDVVWEDKATVYSGEMVISKLVEYLRVNNYKVNRVIQVGAADGVLDSEGEVIRLIDDTFDLGQLGPAHKSDVSGGMRHKVEESLKLADLGVESLIISGKRGNLGRALRGEKVVGTRVT